MAEKNDVMSPDASPGALGKSGVRRVNKMPLMIGIGTLAAFLGAVSIVALKRADQQQHTVVEQPKSNKKANGSDAKSLAEAVTGARTAGIVESADAPAPASTPVADVPQKSAIPIAPVSNPDAPPVPPRGPGGAAPAPSGYAPTPVDPDAERVKQERMRRFEKAVEAKTVVPYQSPTGASGGQGGYSPSSGAPQSREEMLARIAETRRKMTQATSGDANASYQAQLAQIRASMGGAGGAYGGTGGTSATDGAGSPLTGAPASSRDRNDIQQFAGNGQADRWKLEGEVQAPRTPYELRAGAVIPGLMLSGINSDLPGPIIAQVSQNVYDTATGRHLVIPQFSKLYGTYSSQVVYGQSAVMVAWQRIVFPDGKALDLGAMPGADAGGYAGFRDQVNNHYVRIFGSALLMSGVIAAITLSQDQNTNTGPYSQPTASSELRQALGQQLGQVTAQMIAKNLNIAPTLEIRPGYRFNIIAVKDIPFAKAYKSFDY